MRNTYRISEIFKSHQGEGKYTGQLSYWVRFFACNLQCNGFGQKDPKDPSTYILPYKDLDLTEIKSLKELPVLEYGCDSAYSWAAKFKSLCPVYTAKEIVNELSKYEHATFNFPHLVFTGGEPLLDKNQQGILEIVEEFRSRMRFFRHITVETNGTQELTADFEREVSMLYTADRGEFFFSVSPKLESVSGESHKRAIKPEVVAEYQRLVYPNLCCREGGQLKFVVANKKECWDELEEVLALYRHAGVEFPVWVQPVGATVTQQLTDDVSQIALEALARGYNISARVQAYLYKNAMSY